MLDIQLYGLLEDSRRANLPDLADLPPPGARELYSGLLARTDMPVADVEIQTRTIDGPGGPLTLRIYRPRGDAKPLGAVLYLHGGGFVVGCPRDYDGVVSTLALQSGCLLVQVDYRLAPEHPFPAAVEDCYAALTWLGHHADQLGGDPARLAIAGDSAGGNLAAVCAILARDGAGPALASQVLVYPVTAPAPDLYPSYRLYGEDYVLTGRAVHSFFDHYHGGRDSTTDFRAAPLLAHRLDALPPALVLVAGYDVLRDEGIAYAHAMTTAGTATTLVEYPGLAHGFINMAGVLDSARVAVDQVAAFLRRSLNAQTPK